MTQPPAYGPALDRVLVIGSSCAGKSTFAHSLAHAQGQPAIELDALFWGLGWQPVSAQEFRARVAEACAGERWIIEGNYGGVRDILWPRAGTVVWLNYGFALMLWRALWRTAARLLTRRELWHGNRESFRRSFLARESILVWVATTFHRRRGQFTALRASGSFAHLCWIEFRHPAQAERFLQRLPPR